MTQGHHLGKRENTTRLPTHLSHGKKNHRWYHLEGHEGTEFRSLVSFGGAQRYQVEPGSHTAATHTQLQGLGEEKGNCPHMPPGTSMADITAHALPSGDGEKMKIDHHTNDPRPSLGKTQKTQLDYQPTFHTERKTVAGIIWRGTGGPS